MDESEDNNSQTLPPFHGLVRPKNQPLGAHSPCKLSRGLKSAWSCPPFLEAHGEAHALPLPKGPFILSFLQTFHGGVQMLKADAASQPSRDHLLSLAHPCLQPECFSQGWSSTSLPFPSHPYGRIRGNTLPACWQPAWLGLEGGARVSHSSITERRPATAFGSSPPSPPESQNLGEAGRRCIPVCVVVMQYLAVSAHLTGRRQLKLEGSLSHR